MLTSTHLHLFIVTMILNILFPKKPSNMLFEGFKYTY